MTMNSALSLATIAFAAALSVPVVQAQSDNPITIDIPFAYTAGGKMLPAGSYSVDANIGRGFVTLRNRENPKLSMMVPANTARVRDAQEASKLVFHRYNDTYFLSQVWTQGNEVGAQLLPSKAEKEFVARNAKLIILASRNQ
jgi:hypothetical protein